MYNSRAQNSPFAPQTCSLLYVEWQKDVFIGNGLCQSVSTVQIHQTHMCTADLTTERLKHLIKKKKRAGGGTGQEAAQKKILSYWEVVEYSEREGY